MNAAKAITEEFKKAKSSEQRAELANRLSELIYGEVGMGCNPVGNVRWVHYSQVHANDYNPNSVPSREMKLLHTSIDHDGYTQPVVTVWDAKRGKYVIIDGFHRYTIMCRCEDIREKTDGFMPIVVLEKDINDRMASTVRHNRARGKHAITGMSSMVFNMLKNGWTDARICEELGMEPDELVRLKHMTGYSKLYEGCEYSFAWEAKPQIKERIKYAKENPDHPKPIAGGWDEESAAK